MRTNRSLGVAFDEGASWIHGVDGNPITQLADQAGMKTAFSDDESIVSYDINTVLRSDSEYADAEDEFYSVLETLKIKVKLIKVLKLSLILYTRHKRKIDYGNSFCQLI